MLEKLKQIEEKYTELENRLQQPEVYSDPAEYAKLAREQKEIAPVVEAYRAYRDALQRIEDAAELLSDPELKALAQEELQQAKEDSERLAEELKLLLLPRDPDDDKNVVIEIRSGTGGDEACLFAGDLFRMYTRFCEKKHWKIEVNDFNEGTSGGYKDISFTVSGEEKAYLYFTGVTGDDNFATWWTEVKTPEA